MIKVGDIVVRRNGDTHRGQLHNKVTSISSYGRYLRVNDEEVGSYACLFEVVDVSKYHKHRDLIIAWANGAEIQYLNLIGIWKTTKSPRWFIDRDYRIKPKETSELEKLIKEHKAMGETIDKLTKELMNESD